MRCPGLADPGNALLPFGQFDRLHFARLVVLEDSTLGDIAAYGLPLPEAPDVSCVHGRLRRARARAARRDWRGAQAPGFGRSSATAKTSTAAGVIFSPGCRRTISRLPQASSTGSGRTVVQIKQESALQRALSRRVARGSLPSGAEARQRRLEFDRFRRWRKSARGGFRSRRRRRRPSAGGSRKSSTQSSVPLVALIALPFLILLSPLLAFSVA